MEAPDHEGIGRYEDSELGQWLGGVGLDGIDQDVAACCFDWKWSVLLPELSLPVLAGSIAPDSR